MLCRWFIKFFHILAITYQGVWCACLCAVFLCGDEEEEEDDFRSVWPVLSICWEFIVCLSVWVCSFCLVNLYFFSFWFFCKGGLLLSVLTVCCVLMITVFLWYWWKVGGGKSKNWWWLHLKSDLTHHLHTHDIHHHSRHISSSSCLSLFLYLSNIWLPLLTLTLNHYPNWMIE